VPVPHLLLIFPVISSTFGKPLLSANFSRQDLRGLGDFLVMFSTPLMLSLT
jgi:hypothetical protein